MQEIFSTQEWDKTFQVLSNVSVNISIYSKKGEYLIGDENTPFMEVEKPDTKDNYLFIPVNIDSLDVIVVCKPIVSIDKSVKVIQKVIDLLNLTLEKKDQHEQLRIKYSYLKNISQAKNVDRLVQATLEFLVHKLKLANCTVKLNGKSFRYFATKTFPIYEEAEKIIHKQTENSKVISRINSIKEDFMLNKIDNIEELPNSMFSLPLVIDKFYLGTVFCYTDKINNRAVNYAEIIAQDFSKNIGLLSELQEAKTNAQTDNLTGLFNRTLLFPYVDKTIETNLREEKSTSLLMFDIDDFKKYNDTHGHLQGDEILKKISEEVRKLPLPSITFRYGGEEFVTLLSGIDVKEAKEIGERLRIGVEENCELTVSIGCMTCKNSNISSKRLIEEADKALYRAKSLGKNKVVQFVMIDPSLGVIDTSQT